MCKVRLMLLKWLLGGNAVSEQNWKRFVAMYFPNAKVRRKYWLETCVELGEGSYLNPSVTVADDYHSKEVLVKIGRNCSISPGVVFVAMSQHNNSKVLRESGLVQRYEKRAPIVVGDDVWIGANTVVLPGVNIGSCSIIGANSLVNSTIPPYSLAYGTPAKVKGNLNPVT